MPVMQEEVARSQKIRRLEKRTQPITPFSFYLMGEKNMLKSTESELSASGAYVLGALIGDKTSVSRWYDAKEKKWRYQVGICAGKDESFADAWLVNLRNVFNKNYGFKFFLKSWNSWVASTGSKKVFLYIIQFIREKWDSYTWAVPKEILGNTIFEQSFLRGYFDAEAHPREYSINVQSVNKLGLRCIQSLLQEHGIESHFGYHKRKKVLHGNKEYYYLTISARENIQRFQDEIGFLIERKATKLQDSLASYRRNYHRGRFKEILSAMKATKEPMTASQLAENLNIKRVLVSYALKSLHKGGHVNLIKGKRWVNIQNDQQNNKDTD